MNKSKLNEALQIDYRLRSTFFYRKLHELDFITFEGEIHKLIAIQENFNWDSYINWGISELAWQTLVSQGIPPLAVFAHPRVIQEQPKLSAYYRNVAALPQKAVNKLAFTIKQVEAGQAKLSSEKALILCRLYNSHSSLIVESASDFQMQDVIALMLASAGAQINGSWLNQVGREAEIVTQKLLIRALLEAGSIVSIITKSGETSQRMDNLIERVDEISGIRLHNQTSMLFSSEPDLSILSPSGALVAVIEIKGGKDTAGALERYGAAKKSFEQAMRENPEVITIFLASCITSEVEARLATDRVVHHTYNLTDIVSDESQRKEFINFILSLLKINFRL